MLDPSSRALDGNVPSADVAPLMASVAYHLDWALFFAVDRIPFAKRWFRIWRNMSRAASLMLRHGPYGCFIELCAGATLVLIAAALVLSRWDNLVWLPNCCSPLHWGQILDRIQLEGPKKCWRSCCVYDGFVMARPCDQAFPAVWLLRGHLVKKNEIFPAFQILFEQTSNTGELVLR